MRIAAVLLTLSLSTLAYAADPAQQTFESGRTAFLSGNLDKAVDLFEKAVELRPNNASYQYWLGSAYGRKAATAGKLSQARLAFKTRDAFEAAIKLDPKYLDPRFAIIEYYLLAPGFMGGGEEKAVAQANEIRKLDAISGHRAWWRIYRHQKKNDRAAAEMAAMVRNHPQSAVAHYHFGIAQMTEKNYRAALDAFEKSISLDANYSDAWFRAGQTAAMGNLNPSRGEELLRRYLGTTPDADSPPLARAWYWLGTIQEKQGKKADAKASFQNALRLSPEARDVTAALKRVS